VARWLEKAYGKMVVRRTEEAYLLWQSFAGDKMDDEHLLRRVLELDPLNTSANFNLGIFLANEGGEPNEAMWRFWAVALYDPMDAEAWKNAYFSAHNANDPHGMILTLSLLIYFCGGGGYELLRQNSLEAGVPVDVQAKMDDLAMDYMQSYRNSKKLGTRGYLLTDAELFDDGLAHIKFGN